MIEMLQKLPCPFTALLFAPCGDFLLPLMTFPPVLSLALRDVKDMGNVTGVQVVLEGTGDACISPLQDVCRGQRLRVRCCPLPTACYLK